MPNWCSNRVTVCGKLAEVKQLKERVKGIESFSFDSVLPMPEELKTVQSPVSIMTQEKIEEYKKKWGSHPLHLTLPITQETSDRLDAEYGANNWYDWANENWGTKWDARDVTLEDSTLDGEETYGELEYTFDTAWGPPEGVHSILTKDFPTLSITWFWDEPGMELAGYL